MEPSASPSSVWLPTLCAFAFSLWQLAIGYTTNYKDAQQSPSLLTPTESFRAFYYLRSLLLLASIFFDGFYRQRSVFVKAARPSVVRALFILSCVLNTCWSLLAHNDKQLLSALAATLAWLVVLAVYLLALYERSDSQFTWLSFVGSELGIRLLFASASITTVLSWTGATAGESSTLLSSYLVPLGVLCVLALIGLVHGGDSVLAMAIAWFLVALAANTSPSDSSLLDQVQASAALAAGVLVSMLVVSIVISELSSRRRTPLNLGSPLSEC